MGVFSQYGSLGVPADIDDVLLIDDVDDPSMSITGTTKTVPATGLLSPGFYPAAGNPRIPKTVITQFQSGHGFTLAGGGATSDINDTTAGNFVCGSQAATVVTLGDGATFANLANTALSFDSAGKYLLVRYRLSQATGPGALHLDIATDTGFVNYYRWDFHEKFALGAGFAYDGEWEQIILSFADATVTGTPSRSGLVAARLRVRDTGTAVTVQWQEISLVNDPATVFPNGVVTICFDDGYQTAYDNGRPVMDAYGFRATLHVEALGVGGSGNLTLAECQALRDHNGWEVGCHAYSTTVHANNDVVTPIAQVETDWRQEKAWLARNGFKGGEVFAYPGGIWSPAVTALAKNYFLAARLTNWATTETFPPAQAQKLRGVGQISSFAGAKPASQITAMIDATAANRSWLILIFHKIVTGTPGANTECSVTDFQAIMSHLSASGVPVRTMSEVIRLAAAQVA